VLFVDMLVYKVFEGLLDEDVIFFVDIFLIVFEVGVLNGGV